MASSTDERLIIDPSLLTRLSGIDVRSRNVVEGLYNNRHRTRDFGSSTEFVEFREYRAGDEVRSIDWRVFARTDQYHVRLHEMESIMRVNLVVDSSASMRIPATAGLPSKLEMACVVAGAIATVTIGQQDAAGLALVADRISPWIPARQGQSHLLTLYRHLAEPPGEGESGDFGALLGDAVARIGRRGLVFVITDAVDDIDSLFEALKLLRVRENDVALIQVLDERELTFPFEQMTEFRHPEHDRRVICDPLVERERYLEALGAHHARLEEFCGSRRIDYLRLSTASDLVELLSLYFLRRLMEG